LREVHRAAPLRRHRGVDHAEADPYLLGKDRGHALGLHHARQEDADAVGPSGWTLAKLDAEVLEALLDMAMESSDQIVQLTGRGGIRRREPEQAVTPPSVILSERGGAVSVSELAHELVAALGVRDRDFGRRPSLTLRAEMLWRLPLRIL